MTDSQIIEKKIARDAKIIKWLFVGLFTCLAALVALFLISLGLLLPSDVWDSLIDSAVFAVLVTSLLVSVIGLIKSFWPGK